MDNIVKDFEKNCQKSIDHLKSELTKLRTGRATSGLLENITVDYYGAQTPLNQLGLINVPEPRLITVQVYDASAIDAVEKAIQQAGLGLNPARDGNLVRVPVPALTEERRKDLVKGLGKLAEDSRVSVRGHRKGANDLLKKAKDNKEITEDDLKKFESDVQKITDKNISEIDSLLAEKEKEIMSV